MSQLLGSMETFAPGDDFEEYIDRLGEYLKCNEVAEAKKTSVFITLIGSEAYKTLKTVLAPVNPNTKSYDELVSTLRKLYAPKKFCIAERFKFYQRSQKQGESIMDYIVALKLLSRDCKFGTFLDQALRDKFIFGLYNSKIQERLLDDDDASFEDVAEKSIKLELIAEDQQIIKPNNINAVSNRYNQHRSQISKSIKSRIRASFPSRSGSQASQPNIKCQKCGNHHKYKCPAMDITCYLCKCRGHFAKFCKNSARDRQIRIINEDSESESRVNNIFSLSCNSSNRLITQVIIEGRKIEMEVDTGACQSIISYVDYFSLFKHLLLKSCSFNLQSVTGHKLEYVGVCEAMMEWPLVGVSKRGKQLLEMSVVKCQENVIPIFRGLWLDTYINFLGNCNGCPSVISQEVEFNN